MTSTKQALKILIINNLENRHKEVKIKTIKIFSTYHYKVKFLKTIIPFKLINNNRIKIEENPPLQINLRHNKAAYKILLRNIPRLKY